MSTIVTRSGKGSPLSHVEVDANFTNLNTDKIESGNTVATLTVTSATINGGSINGTTIGATTASTGAFTTLGATGVATFSAGTVALPSITTTGDTNTGIYFPAADTIAFTEGGVESMRIDSGGNLLVGTPTSPASGSGQAVISTSLGVNVAPTARITTYDGSAYGLMNGGNTTPGGSLPWLATYNTSNATTANYGWGFYNSNADGNLELWTRDGTVGGYGVMSWNRTTGNIRVMGSNCGIQFNNSSAVSNSVLNDYEAGSFSPTILFGGNNAGQTFANGPNGRYVKIGRFVYVLIGAYFSNKGSSTGTLTIGNLPFTSDNFGFYGNYNITNSATFTGITTVATVAVNGGLNVMNLYQGNNQTVLTDSNITNASYFIINCCYTASF